MNNMNYHNTLNSLTKKRAVELLCVAGEIRDNEITGDLVRRRARPRSSVGISYTQIKEVCRLGEGKCHSTHVRKLKSAAFVGEENLAK